MSIVSGTAFWRNVAAPSGSTGVGAPSFAATSDTTANDDGGSPPVQFAVVASAWLRPCTACLDSTGSFAGDPTQGSSPGSVTRCEPPSVTEKPTHASQNRMLTHTCPSSFHGDGPWMCPWKCSEKPWPWKLTSTPPSTSAMNENGENTNIASNAMKPYSVAPDFETRASSFAPVCAVFDVSAK